MSASSGYGSGGGSTPVAITLTGNVGGAVGPTANNFNIVGAGGVLVTGNPGTSTLTITIPTDASQYDGDVGSAVPSAGILNIIGGASTAGINMNTFASGNTVEIILNDSILLPTTTADGLMGVIFIDGDTFMHAFGTNNTFLGSDAGNLTLAGATNNTGIGLTSLNALTTGDFNTASGSTSLINLTTGSNNTGLGSGALSSLVTGSNNISVGSGSGTALAGAESNDIYIGNAGVLAESATIRVGTGGTQTAAYVAGIYNQSYASPSGVVQVDSNNKLGSSAGTDGQLLIGDTGASPVWANLASAGGTVVITNLAGGINLEATGVGGGASSFPADIGTAVEAGGFLNILGGPSTAGTNIFTTGAGNTIEIALNDSILLPNTNALGDGIIYLGGQQFISNFGSGNTFLGNSAGNLTLTTVSAIDNTAVGDNALPALTTSPENTFIGSNAGTLLASGAGLNTAAGFAVLDNLVSGSNNIALGTLAGTNYTTNESNNILLGSFGTVGDNQTIRIGRTQTAAYMEGVYNRSIGTTNAPVFIDNTGKLGTLEAGTPLDGSSFMAVVSPFETLTAINPLIGTFFVGAQNPMVILYDNFSGAFDPGDGIGGAATFTAPIDGYYTFSAGFVITQISSGSQLNGVINLNGNPYLQMKMYSFSGSGGSNTAAVLVTGNIQLAAGDLVTFSAICNLNTLNPPRGFDGDRGFYPTAPYQTFVSGQLLRTS